MSKTITIHQPDFAPWIGFFDRWKSSDLYIVLDDVQFLRRGWHHRDRIKTTNGPAWLTIPVKKKGKFFQSINEVEMDNTWDWRGKHLKTMALSYQRAPGFLSLFPEIEQIYAMGQNRLMDFNISLLNLFARHLKIMTPMVLASSNPSDKKRSDRLVELMIAYKGDIYLTGKGAKDYLDNVMFESYGLQVQWQTFRHPIYPQCHGAFVPNLSVMDYLMNRPAGA